MTVIGLVTVAGACLASAIMPGQETVPIALVALVLPLCVARAAARHDGMFHPLALFCFAFSCYNGLLLVRFCFIDLNADTTYNMIFLPHSAYVASWLSAVASIAILITWVFFGRKEPSRTDRRPVEEACFNRLYWAGFLCVVVGLALYFLYYQELGGYIEALSKGRAERFEPGAQVVLVSLPYLPLMLAGLSGMTYAVAKGTGHPKLLLICIFVWSLLLALQGDRRLIVQSLLAVVFVYFTLHYRKFVPRVRLVLVLLLGYVLFSLFGQVRELTKPISAGLLTWSEAFDWAEDHYSINWIMPERSEFAGPYFSLLDAVENHPQPELGRSYLNTLPAFLPKAAYPSKPMSIAEEFALQVHSGADVASGWGFSPLAEAFRNFGVIGVAMIPALLTLFFIYLNRLRNRSPFGVVIAAVLVGEAINVNRIDFRTVYLESFFGLWGVLFLVLLWKLTGILYKCFPPVRVFSGDGSVRDSKF
jgi:hypothetical protein